MVRCLLMELGNNIAKLRGTLGLSQRNLADILNVSSGAVAMWETNKRQPDISTLVRIADFFDTSTDSLLGRNAQKPLSANEGQKLIQQALKDTGLLDQNGELSEEGGKIIAKFLRDNTDTLKIMLQLSKQEEK